MTNNGEGWNGERREPRGHVVPVECRPGIETNTIDKSYNIVEGRIVWSNPGDPVKVRQCLEDVTGEEVPTVEVSLCQKRKEWLT